ncbi:hypothetical protein RDI58_012503 [Solanum bulbocastanum]|uniref:Uncharacterized protein n=1 Tax=Solanum bulbocastanum TaxID=147425 RepID=A0AAN8TJ17_SOLBU
MYNYLRSQVLPLVSMAKGQFQANGKNDSTCPKFFSCGNLTDFSFPFSLSSRSDCGLMSGCDTKTYPRIQLLPGGDWYNPIRKPPNFTVWLLDPKLHTMLRQHKCQNFSKSFSLQDSPSISFTTPTLHDFFKCNSTSRNAPNTTQKKNDHFAGYKIYNGCKDFSIYYKLSGDDDEDI